MDQDSSKNQNPPAILNQTKNLLFCPFVCGHLQHHRNRDQNWPRECFRDAGHLSWTHPYSAHSWGSEQVWGGFLCQNWISRALFHLAPSLNTTRWHWFQLLCPFLVKLNECSLLSPTFVSSLSMERGPFTKLMQPEACCQKVPPGVTIWKKHQAFMPGHKSFCISEPSLIKLLHFEEWGLTAVCLIRIPNSWWGRLYLGAGGKVSVSEGWMRLI